MPEAEYRAALIGAGLPEPFAALLADSDAAAAGGALFDDSHTLSRLIGRPTTPFAATIAKTLAAWSGTSSGIPGSQRVRNDGRVRSARFAFGTARRRARA